LAKKTVAQPTFSCLEKNQINFSGIEFLYINQNDYQRILKSYVNADVNIAIPNSNELPEKNISNSKLKHDDANVDFIWEQRTIEDIIRTDGNILDNIATIIIDINDFITLIKRIKSRDLPSLKDFTPISYNPLLNIKLRKFRKRFNYLYKDDNLLFIEFLNLSIQDCFYCGAKPKNKTELPSNGLDRIDNNKGHSIDNVVPCCIYCNKSKRNFSFDQFIDHLKRLKEFKGFIKDG
jgi:hypothetical protein